MPDSYGDPQAEQSSLVVVRRKLEWKLDFRALARSSAEGPPIVVAFSTSRLRWSMVQKRQSLMKSACDYPLSSAKPARKPASFEEPVSETRCFYRFGIRCFPACGCTTARWSGCRSGTAKKSSHPWHFRCWSPSRNDLECTNLVHWTEALHRFSSRDAIIVVSSALEKHFDSDFTQYQEKEITFKRWPPGYQSWKLCLALNGLNGSTCQMRPRVWKINCHDDRFIYLFIYLFIFFYITYRHENVYNWSRLYASTWGRHETASVLLLFSCLSFDVSMIFFVMEKERR